MIANLADEQYDWATSFSISKIPAALATNIKSAAGSDKIRIWK
jgi:hypothetical protein